MFIGQLAAQLHLGKTPESKHCKDIHQQGRGHTATDIDCAWFCAASQCTTTILHLSDTYTGAGYLTAPGVAVRVECKGNRKQPAKS